MTPKKVTLVDYGVANLLNVARALEHCGAQVHIATQPHDLEHAEWLVVPGVGAFSSSIEAFRTRGFDDALRSFLTRQRPFLGVCVGMQMLFDASEEFGEHAGLGLLPGRVVRIPSTTVTGAEQRVPHIGWNHLHLPQGRASWAHTPMAGFESHNPAFYFVHSFAAQPLNGADVLAYCEYGGHRICAAVQKDHLVATQFHPERSGPAGLAFLSAFLNT